ncbi:MAG: hypothetical protein WCK15_19770, partial [Pirellula sp.]
QAAAGLSLDGAGYWTEQVQREVAFFLLISLLLDLPTIGYNTNKLGERYFSFSPMTCRMLYWQVSNHNYLFRRSF